MLTIISGGQTGADVAGLEAARLLKISTGGWAPKNFLTSTGPNPTLLRNIYRLKESKYGYKIRTNQNVNDSDGTIRLCVDFFSPGEICTLDAINKYHKPHFDVYLLNPIHHQECVNWIFNNNIKILNIAGNSQGKRGYDIYTLAGNYIYTVLEMYIWRYNETNNKRNNTR